MPNQTITVGSYRVLDLDVRNLDGSPDVTTALASFGTSNTNVFAVAAVTPPAGQAVRQLYVSALAPGVGTVVAYTVIGSNGSHNPQIAADAVAAATNAASAGFGAWGPELVLPHP